MDTITNPHESTHEQPQLPVIGYARQSLVPWRVPNIAALIAIAALACLILGEIGMSISAGYLIQIIEGIKQGIRPSYNTIYTVDNIRVMFGRGVLAMMVVNIVVFLVWMYRAHRVLPALGANLLAYSPLSCVLWWFCPIANLVMPYRTMREIYVSSQPTALPVLGKARASAWPVSLWWLLCIGHLVAYFAIMGSGDTDNFRHDLNAYVAISKKIILICIPHAIAALAAIYLIFRINTAQKQLEVARLGAA